MTSMARRIPSQIFRSSLKTLNRAHIGSLYHNPRTFSTSLPRLANRAIVYTSTGNPSEVLSARTYPSLGPPPQGHVNVRLLCAPVNPSDVNVIEGVYPVRPSLESLVGSTESVFVGGNEGLGVVQRVGNGVDGLKEGDWVVFAKAQSGTWASERCVNGSDVVRIPDMEGGGRIGEVQGATLTVNPPTAYNMLKEFVDLKAGDWVLQNGANSAVGQAVIQIAAHRGLRTINFVRDRDNMDELRIQLHGLGADQIFTYESLHSKDTISHIKSLTSSAGGIRLLLNCVSGSTTTSLARLLGANATIVSYGAMSKQPLSLPTSLFIFKNLSCKGYWQQRWYMERGRTEREELMRELVGLIGLRKLREPEHEIVRIGGGLSDGEATQLVQGVMDRIEKGHYGKKILFKFDTVDS
ncbi:hypothetical protein JAAARDRAFT_31128 [Jaapia argillacea MUCL 33604]|uniref:enoyl-[acyl-carrier-protein] reductase n=1 Tax=Jaapia argillacea MUCL 33604 TaxID=933084 RepID=A0A067QGB3_9AGAM|nr:hypothetical protein JAAARDRAFT_31128 [Jaapia argillacea MUCL 33604]